MKKAISFALSLLFILTLFAGCGKEIKVADENVSDIFLPTLKCYAYHDGSGLYTIEKNEDGTPKSYGEDENANPLFKVVGFDSYEQLVSEYGKYISKDFVNATAPKETSFKKTDDGLLVAKYDGGSVSYDPKSVKLEKEENGKYYISVDSYNPAEDKKDVYTSTETFTATYKDGILCIKKAESGFDTAKTDKTMSTSELISTFDIFS